MLRYKLYVEDILKTIAQIEKSLDSKTREYFEKDFDIGEATAMRMQIIGESIHKLPKELKEKYNEINWERFVEFRNTVSHTYFKINKDMLWDVVKEELPKLKIIVDKIKNEE